MKDYRAEAAREFEATSVPTADEELWRYSRIGEFDLNAYQLPTHKPEADLPGAVADLVSAIGQRSALVVTRNGFVSHLEVDAKGLRVVAAGEWANGSLTSDASDYFTKLNSAFTQDPVLVEVSAGQFVEHPIVVVHWQDQEMTAAFPRVVVNAGESSQASVIECFITADDLVAFTASVSELSLAQAANLQYVAVQQLGLSVWQMARQVSKVERDATLHSTSIAFGGHYARVSTESHLIGQGANSKLNAVYFGNDLQMHDFRTLQAHDAPKSTSDLLFKGAVGGNARSVYSGLIRVTKGASGTRAFQTNRNLVLSQKAHADSVPNLEIEENDVSCSHASAVGPIDEDQLYYLESRGVPTDVAERLIIMGFLDELLTQLPIAGLRTLLKETIAHKLNNLNVEVGR